MTEEEKRLLFIMAGVVAYLFLGTAHGKADPKAEHVRSSCPSPRYRTAGAWRGKGSFGTAPFGPQVRHR